MGALIDDLTDLSLIETGAVALDLAPLDAWEIARDVLRQFGFRAHAAGCRDPARSPVSFPVDRGPEAARAGARQPRRQRDQVQQEGGAVRIAGSVTEGRPRITVEDTGAGIPRRLSNRSSTASFGATRRARASWAAPGWGWRS
jgi:two-component system sensor histidine kinase BaeS